MRFVLVSLLALPASALAVDLSISGACPGPMDIVVTDAAPGSNVVVVTGSGPGAAPLPAGPCAGMSSGLAGPLNWHGPLRTDGRGSASVRPSIPGPVCSLSAVAVDIATCEISPVRPFSAELPPQCTDYIELGEADRNVDWAYDYARCDDWIPAEGDWYRFVGAAGTQMPEYDPDEYGCGTHAAGWLDGVHPATPGETVTQPVCYSWTPGPCWQTNDIEITNCGGYYVYQLYRPLSCSYRYCGE